MRADTLLTARHFVAALGPDQPVFGIWMRAMHGAAHEGGSVDELAATCRRLIAEEQPTGPYYLFGYSIGGLVAYEVARQYAAAGERAALVVMADTPYLGPLPTRRDHLAKLFSREGPAAVARRAAAVARRLPLVREKVPTRPPTALEQRAAAFREVGVDMPATLHRERAYVSSPRPAAAPVTMLCCRDSVEVISHGSPVLGWEQYVRDDWDVREVPGSHDSMLGEPHVHVLAATLADCLGAAQAREGRTGGAPR
jgi:thioesterase domain-containing protein